MTQKIYKPTFDVPFLDPRGRKHAQRIAVVCTNEDYFFYSLLTNQFKRGIIEGSDALNAEVNFFYNGYTWIDNGGTIE